MDLRQAILESLIEKLLSQRIDELSGDTLRSYIFKAQKSGPHQKGSNRDVGIKKAKYRSERLKSEADRFGIEPEEFKGHTPSRSVEKKKPEEINTDNQFGRSDSDLNAPLPLNGNKRGDSTNTSRGPTSTEKAAKKAREAARLQTVRNVFAARNARKKKGS